MKNGGCLSNGFAVDSSGEVSPHIPLYLSSMHTWNFTLLWSRHTLMNIYMTQILSNETTYILSEETTLKNAIKNSMYTVYLRLAT